MARSVKLNDNRDLASLYLPEAERLLFSLKQRQGGVGSLWESRTLFDGTEIKVARILGNEYVEITSPFPRKPGEEKELPPYEVMLFFIDGFSYTKQYICALHVKVHNGKVRTRPLDSETFFDATNLLFKDDSVWNLSCDIQSNKDATMHLSIVPHVKYSSYMQRYGIKFVEKTLYLVYGTQWAYSPISFDEDAEYAERQTTFANLGWTTGVLACGKQPFSLSADNKTMTTIDNTVWRVQTANVSYETEYGSYAHTEHSVYMKYATSTSYPTLVDGAEIEHEIYTRSVYLIEYDPYHIVGTVTDYTTCYIVSSLTYDKALYTKLSFFDIGDNLGISSSTSITKSLIWGTSLIATGIYHATGSGGSGGGSGLFNLNAVAFASYKGLNGVVFFRSEDYSWTASTDHITAAYKLCIVVNGNPGAAVSIATCQDDGGTASGQFITNVSCWANKDRIVYTYCIYNIDDGVADLPDYDDDISAGPYTFVKRVVGVMDTPSRQRNEFEINDLNAASILTEMYPDYDYKHWAAIGVHKGTTLVP